PAIIEVIRSGRVHLTGVRLLLAHLTPENHREVLARAAGKSKREIEELVVAMSPRPLVPTMIRTVPAQASVPVQPQALQLEQTSIREVASPSPAARPATTVAA